VRKQRTRKEIDGEHLLDEVQRFVALARSGAYIGGTRAVSRQERTKWRPPASVSWMTRRRCFRAAI
jgi:hypothetical protein